MEPPKAMSLLILRLLSKSASCLQNTLEMPTLAPWQADRITVVAVVRIFLLTGPNYLTARKASLVFEGNMTAT